MKKATGAKRGRKKAEILESGPESPEEVKDGQAEKEAEETAVVPSHHVEEAPAPSEDQIRIAESRKALLQPLGIGQAYFEAPDGTIIVGEADRPHVWFRQGNGGKGCFINPKR